ncbi:ring-cleaving dioxygenase [Baekduia soli]|uniref:Ring-cleaving dioxygenase n=1 Tax=Baekduia soli TaxID=496014 RepID=A0A5B8U2X7_9ACTN|nr:VOC family protein [Baekduia soli]QEC47374.1 ring-cleaving dioxygenase [Baekduia soli]
MKLEGLHHITMITGDARGNVAFYAYVLGLRLVKKTVNFDAPEAYHLYFGDEQGSPGSILTWFEFAGAAPGRAGAGMIHTLQLGVAAPEALEFWQSRLHDAGHRTRREPGVLRFADPDGLVLELVVADDGNPPLRAVHPDVPAEHAITGLEGARAYTHDVATHSPLLTEVLGFDDLGGGEFRLQGDERHLHWAYDPAPEAPGRQGAGTVHHIAWASQDADHDAWRRRVGEAGGHVTPVIDRDYFLSIYFREPRGILFEIATLSPGFAVDEDPEHLGEALRLPTQHEHLRAELERVLTPLVNPRAARAAKARS